MDYFTLGFFSLLVTKYSSFTDALQCYSCKNIANVNDCNTSVECEVGQSCILQTNGGNNGSYLLGCVDNQQCSATGIVNAAIVGRSVFDNGRRAAPRVASACHECCSTNFCNVGLCQHHMPSDCVDSPGVDCARMNTILNFCQNKDQAKLVCPNFCGLCDLVDGNWADCSIWSGCDVTCGSGTQSRDRTCTNPAPEHGGQDCIGSNTESKAGNMNPCPKYNDRLYNVILQFTAVGASGQAWGSCSVTCDVGIQRRDRSCSNPYPALNGDHCFGESRDDRICQLTACANGGWSSWETWSTCGVTCGGGLITRQRYCNNPPPSLLGDDCPGKGEEYTLCNIHTCTNHVAFSVQLSGRYTTEAAAIVFDVIKLNEGQAYNPHTGIFTAPFKGLYTFAVYILEDNPHTTSDWADFYLRKNDDHEAIGAVDISFSDNSNALFLPGSITVVENLNRGDRIFVTCIAKGKFVHGGPFSKFSGYLIAEN